MKLFWVGLFYSLGVFRLARWLNRRRLVILTYHGVLPSTYGGDGDLSRNFIDERQFRRQMRYLSKRYRCLKLSEAIAALSSGRALPPHSSVVTFDDGFKNNLDYAYPILEEYRIPCAIFLTTGHIGNPSSLLWTEKVRLMLYHSKQDSFSFRRDGVSLTLPLGASQQREEASQTVLTAMKSISPCQREKMISDLETQLGEIDGAQGCPERYAFLSWEEISKADSSLVEWGSHTINHQILSTLSNTELSNEIEFSKREIEERLRKSCLLFSYPNGSAADFGERDKEALKKAGYLCAVTQMAGLNDSETDLYALKRINIGRGHRDLLFIAQVSGVWSFFKKMISWINEK